MSFKTNTTAVVGLAIALTSTTIMSTEAAYAGTKVYTPYVHKGEFELEYRGATAIDDNSDINGSSEHKFAVGYGVTDTWFTELYAEIEHAGDAEGETALTAIEWENKFQLSDQGEHWLDIGLLTEYVLALEDNAADKVEAKLLFAKQTGQWLHLLNLGLEKEIGANASEPTEGNLAWSTRYLYKQAFEPGFELFSDFGPISENKPYKEQKHFIGPAIYGKIGPVKYDVGYLFGISDAASDGVAKVNLEYEIYF